MPKTGETAGKVQKHGYKTNCWKAERRITETNKIGEEQRKASEARRNGSKRNKNANHRKPMPLGRCQVSLRPTVTKLGSSPGHKCRTAAWIEPPAIRAASHPGSILGLTLAAALQQVAPVLSQLIFSILLSVQKFVGALQTSAVALRKSDSTSSVFESAFSPLLFGDFRLDVLPFHYHRVFSMFTPTVPYCCSQTLALQ